MWHRNPLRTIETSFLWFLSPTLTLNTIPRMVLRAIRGEGSKTQVYVSFPHSLFAWKLAAKILLLTDFSDRLLSNSQSLMFCHSSWNEGGFCLPFPLTSRWGLKCVVAAAPFFLCPGLFCALGFFHPCAQSYWAICFLPLPRADPNLQSL